MRKVTLYGKPDCCLCDDAKGVLQRVRAELPFELEEVDVSRSPELLERYGDRIPLIWIDGRLAFKYHVQPEELRKRLARKPRRLAA